MKTNVATVLRVQIPLYCIEEEIEDTAWEKFINHATNVVEFDIYLPSGQIDQWPQGKKGFTNCWKIRDEGTYILCDFDGTELYKKSDCYVPSILSGTKDESDDYVELDVKADGTINNWAARQVRLKFLKPTTTFSSGTNF